MTSKNVVLALGFSLLLFACGKDEGASFDQIGSNSGASLGTQSAKGQALAQALQSSVASESFDTKQLQIIAAGSSSIDALLNFHFPTTGNLSSIASDNLAVPDCAKTADVTDTGAFYIPKKDTFDCAGLQGSVIVTPLGLSLQRTTVLQIGSGDQMASIDHGITFYPDFLGKKFKGPNVIVGFNHVNDRFIIGGKSYSVSVQNGTDNYSASLKLETAMPWIGETDVSTSMLELSGAVTIATGDDAGIVYQVTSQDLQHAACGFSAGSITLASDTKKYEVTFTSDCGLPTVTETDVAAPVPTVTDAVTP